MTAVLPMAGHGKALLHGVVRELKKSPFKWSLRPVEPGRGMVKDELEEWSPDAVLIQVGHDEAIQWCRDHDTPFVVLLTDSEGSASYSMSAGIDDRAVGRVAAEYFLSRAYRNFAFVGNENYTFSIERKDGFEGILGAHGRQVHPFLHATPEFSEGSGRRVIYHQAIGEWLRQLPKPVAVLASNDIEALSTIQAATEEGIRVPEEVSILGVGDDPLICQLCSPDLSSVKLPFTRLGSEAIRMLLSALSSKKGSHDSHVSLLPICTITRASSDTQRIEDTVVADAMDYFSNNIEEPVKVRDLLDHLNVSRANLERRFKAEFGHTPLVELRRLRIERAQRLLMDTKLNNGEIAARSGFTSNIRFVTVFKQLVGTTPANYREQIQLEA
ncbi:substrate-binding domain-containing protein [Coraliomargarita sp. W4R53]